MGYGALTAFIEKDRVPPAGIVVTVVLPGGCPLNCAFCIVNQRDERREQSYLSADHLTSLLSSIERRGLLGGAAIAGDEPLQEHCWPAAKAFLSRALESKVPTALITNGYNLVDFLLNCDSSRIPGSLSAWTPQARSTMRFAANPAHLLGFPKAFGLQQPTRICASGLTSLPFSCPAISLMFAS